MPVTLTQFPRLTLLTLYNVSHLSWPMEAAPRHHLQPMLSQVLVFRANMTECPTGLVHSSLPMSLSVLIYGSNLTHVPEDCGDHWRSHVWQFFKIEHARLQSLPHSMGLTTIHRLSLIDNQLAALPDSLFTNHALTSVVLSQNPLRGLPVSLGDPSTLHTFFIADTPIDKLPDGLIAWQEARRTRGLDAIVSLYGSTLYHAQNVTQKPQSSACPSSPHLPNRHYFERLEAVTPSPE